MMTNMLRISAIALALVATTPVMAQQTVGEPAVIAADDGFDWGWIGLLGLIGLAGLSGRKRDDHTTTTTRR